MGATLIHVTPPQSFFTSESVTEGHPDKICDQIADTVLDAFVDRDEQAHVGCEAAATGNHVMNLLSGEDYANTQPVRIIGVDNGV